MAAGETAPPPVTTEAELTQLRAELRAMGRRSAALTLGALLVMGGIVWLALPHEHGWPGWGLLAAGAAKLAHGLWR